MLRIDEDDVLVMLKREMPYYERDDKDDYLYIGHQEDLARIAHNVVYMIRTWESDVWDASRTAQGCAVTETAPCGCVVSKGWRCAHDSEPRT